MKSIYLVRQFAFLRFLATAAAAIDGRSFSVRLAADTGDVLTNFGLPLQQKGAGGESLPRKAEIVHLRVMRLERELLRS